MNETTRTTTTRRRGALAALALASLTALSGCTLISTLTAGDAKPTTTQAEPTSSSTKSPTGSPSPTGTKTPSPSTSTKPTNSGGGYVSYAQAGPGMCVPSTGDVTSTKGFDTVDCATPHAYELMEMSTLPDAAGAPFPGKDQIEQQAEKICTDAFQTYVGVPYTSSKFAFTYVYPTDQTWSAGDRDVGCFFYGSSSGSADDLTGSAAGTKQ